MNIKFEKRVDTLDIEWQDKVYGDMFCRIFYHHSNNYLSFIIYDKESKALNRISLNLFELKEILPYLNELVDE